MKEVERTRGGELLTVHPHFSQLEDGDVLRATGELKLSHAELGLEPFSALGGALSVADAFTVHYKITAHPR